MVLIVDDSHITGAAAHFAHNDGEEAADEAGMARDDDDQDVPSENASNDIAAAACVSDGQMAVPVLELIEDCVGFCQASLLSAYGCSSRSEETFSSLAISSSRARSCQQ